MSKRDIVPEGIGDQPSCKSPKLINDDQHESPHSSPMLLPESSPSLHILMQSQSDLTQSSPVLINTQSECSEHSALADYLDHNLSNEEIDLNPSYDEINQNTDYEATDNIINYEEAAASLLQDSRMKDAIMKVLSQNVAAEWKTCLKVSKLTADKKQRDYLLSINPKDLCSEFKTNCPIAYEIVISVLLGMQTDQVFNNQFLQNNISLLFSVLARLKNRNATGFALFMGMIARDGGLREESLKLLPGICHPRTLGKSFK